MQILGNRSEHGQYMATEGRAQALMAGTGPKGPGLGPRARAQDPCRRRRKAEQSWRSPHDPGAAGASFAPPAPAPELAPAPALPRLAPPPALRLRLRLGPRELSMLHRCYWFVALPKLQSFQSSENLNAILNLKIAFLSSSVPAGAFCT